MLDNQYLPPISERQWCEGCGWMLHSTSGFHHKWGCERGDIFVPQPQTPVGWTCPRCKRIYAPHVDNCLCFQND